jgi:hypothetical protein
MSGRVSAGKDFMPFQEQCSTDFSKQLDHLSAVGSFISGWVIFLWKGMKPFPAPGVRHPISPKDPYEYLIIKGCIWSQLKE